MNFMESVFQCLGMELLSTTLRSYPEKISSIATYIVSGSMDPKEIAPSEFDAIDLLTYRLRDTSLTMQQILDFYSAERYTSYRLRMLEMMRSYLYTHPEEAMKSVAQQEKVWQGVASDEVSAPVEPQAAAVSETDEPVPEKKVRRIRKRAETPADPPMPEPTIPVEPSTPEPLVDATSNVEEVSLPEDVPFTSPPAAPMSDDEIEQMFLAEAAASSPPIATGNGGDDDPTSGEDTKAVGADFGVDDVEDLFG